MNFTERTIEYRWTSV